MTAIGPQFPEVLAAAQEGAEWAWTELYNSIAPQLAGYARAKGAKEPEEIVSDVFHDIARNIGGFSGSESNFRSWVFGIGYNRIVDQWRKQQRRRRDAWFKSRDVASAEQVALDDSLEGPVFAALADLTRAQREVMVLRTVGDLTLEEVAVVLGTNVNAVKALQHRAVAKLRKKLQDPVTK